MVFFVVAAALPQQSEEQNNQALSSCTSVNGRNAATIYPAKVDKAKFKIGTLDSLMELNETLVKVDQTLESTVKRIEKVVLEIETVFRQAGKGNLVIEPFVEIPGKGDKPKLNFLQYVQNFQWESIKYSQGRSLVEISG